MELPIAFDNLEVWQMNKINSKILDDIIEISGCLYAKGWAERNAGNLSIRLKHEDMEHFTDLKSDRPWQKLAKEAPKLAGEFFIVTGTGKYFRNIRRDPENNLGIIELDRQGERYRTVWGYTDGGKPTSELTAHLQAHSVRKEIFGDSVIMHTHPTSLVALTYSDDLDTYRLTKLAWEMHTECMVVFPEGVEYLPWMVPGTNEIGMATAEAFRKRNIVVWQYHGVFAAGKDLDTAFGLIETVDKAADIYLKASSKGEVGNRLTSRQLEMTAEYFGLKPDRDILDRMFRDAGSHPV
jgi:rhamnulose-1-phosphate aldolase